MKKGTRSERDPQKLALQLDRLREMNPDELREQWQTLFGADPTTETPFVAAGSGDCLSAPGESIRRPQAFNTAVAGADRRRYRRTSTALSDAENYSRKRRDRADPGVARHQASGDRSERRIPVPRKALSFAVANRANDHRQSLVRTAVLWTEVIPEGAN